MENKSKGIISPTVEELTYGLGVEDNDKIEITSNYPDDLDNNDNNVGK